MGINSLIEAATILTILAASTGQLPRIVKTVQIAQFKLLQQSQSPYWGKAPTPF